MTGMPGCNPPPKDFESALSELETLVAGLEAGQLTLEQSLNAYRRGVELLAYCERVLGEAEQQVKILEAGALKDLNVGVETENDASD